MEVCLGKEQCVEEAAALICTVRAREGTCYWEKLSKDTSCQSHRRILVKLYLLQFSCKISVFFSGCLCVNGITAVNILLFESDTWYTGQFFCHCHSGTLSRFILPNLRHLTLDTR